MQRFSEKCTLGRYEVVSSIAIYAILAVVILSIFMFEANASNPSFKNIIVIILLLLTVVVPVLLTPRAVELDDTNITIHRLFSKKIIPISEVIMVGRRVRNEFTRDMRLAGGAGLLGYFGLFTNRGLGKYWAIANNSNELIWLVSSNKVRLLSCNNSTEFVDTLSKMINSRPLKNEP